MADRRSQSDESLIVEYFTVQPLAACDALLNQIGDILRRRRPKRSEAASNGKSATELAERKPSQKRKAGKEAQPEIVNFADDTDMQRCAKIDCRCWRDDNIHHKQTVLGYHEFVEPAGEAKGVGV